MKIIYKGARDGKDYDDFTFDKVYEAEESINYINDGLLVIKNDLNKLVLQPSIDFDFI